MTTFHKSGIGLGKISQIAKEVRLAPLSGSRVGTAKEFGKPSISAISFKLP